MNTVTVGRVFIFALVVLPSPYVLTALGGSASPAMLLGLGMFVYWTLTRLSPSLSASHSRQPIRIAALLFLLSIVMSAAAAFARVLPMSRKAKHPIRGIAIALSFVGVCLFFADGIRNRMSTSRRLFPHSSYRRWLHSRCWNLAVRHGSGHSTLFQTSRVRRNQRRTVRSRTIGTSPRSRNGVPPHRVCGCAVHDLAIGIAPRGHELGKEEPHLRHSSSQCLVTAAIPTAMSRTAVVGFATVFVIMSFVWTRRRRLPCLWRTCTFRFRAFPRGTRYPSRDY
jgi:hypothetical protein